MFGARAVNPIQLKGHAGIDVGRDLRSASDDCIAAQGFLVVNHGVGATAEIGDDIGICD